MLTVYNMILPSSKAKVLFAEKVAATACLLVVNQKQPAVFHYPLTTQHLPVN